MDPQTLHNPETILTFRKFAEGWHGRSCILVHVHPRLIGARPAVRPKGSAALAQPVAADGLTVRTQGSPPEAIRRVVELGLKVER